MKSNDLFQSFLKGNNQSGRKNTFQKSNISKKTTANDIDKDIKALQKSSNIIQSNKQIIESMKRPKTSQKPKVSQKSKAQPSIINEIEILTQKLKTTEQTIQQTEKKLDVDLFLKKQKEKKQQYAKDLNKQYEIQKQKRQEKLYKKYNRDKRQDGQTTGQQTTNVKTALPFQLLKVLETEKNSIAKSQWIFPGHHLDFESIKKNDRMIQLLDYAAIESEEKSLLFTESSYTAISIKKMAENSLQVEYFPVNIPSSSLAPSKAYQNLMNSLVLMPKHFSQKHFLTYKQKQTNQQQHLFFQGRLFYNGIRKSVLSNDVIEAKELAHRCINVMSKVDGNRNFGPTLVEKMFRKISANKENLDLRSSLYTLYGLDVQILPISNRNYIKQNFTDLLNFLKMDCEQLVGFMNEDGHNNNIYSGRVYPLKEIIQVVQKPLQEGKKKTKKKAKRESINNQDKQFEKKTLYHLQNPWKGLNLDSKAINKFQLLELFEMFNRIVLIRQYPKSWVCKRINLELFSTGPMSMTNNEWTKNNQYSFSISSNKPINLRIVMRKQHTSDSQGILQKNDNIDQEGSNLFGFLLFAAKDGETKISCLKMQTLITKTKSSDLINGASFNYEFQKGNYFLIPFSNKVTKTSYQFFNLDFFVEKEDVLTFGKAALNEWKWTSKGDTVNSQGDVKVIQSLESNEVFQKPKIQDIAMNRISNHNGSFDKLLKNIKQQHLNIPQHHKLSDVLIPGKLTKFLINPEIQTSKKKQRNQAGKKSEQSAKSQNHYNSELQTYEKEQALSILLGYDVLQNQDIDRGRMLVQTEQNQDVIDFAHFNLGRDGLTAIMQTLMVYPNIRTLNLSDNDLDDSSVVYLCYYLDKGNRIELREIDLSENNFGKIGRKALQGLLMKYKKLKVMY